MANESNGKDLSRRRFLKNSGYAAGGVIGGGILGSIFGMNFGGEPEPSTTIVQQTNPHHALMYFTREKDFEILSAATERIFPEDENGPGAIQLGVPYFIDHQLAGAYGNNDREYMQGPFFPGSDFQGYQTRLKRHEIFMEGILAIDRESNKEYNTSFTDLDGEQQDAILQKFENSDVKMKGVKSGEFFQLLSTATLAGAYADPLYSGNVDMEGWKMKEYPGHQMSYINEIENEEFIEIEPQSLRRQHEH
ncbi:gluconate 2-dehydrogenase gamma chain [Lentibacillus halodurans]|uniref:Gluconate 2-dehydrogenase gamma chain n=1 Tax=Lentibacillus halodurans TaxID=237679 RepID=A0A1I0XLJ2_9BACI|nr:gluconate 2-dehydrogenase subunit 3 family protein [Lentibacillus halodurans]SFB01925.1 gluconate 2-dehydrogenase gamma chain [Lentibacillus halodurans]